jgi:hypothetical protein
MERFFFDVVTPEFHAADRVGELMQDRKTALEEARKSAGQLVAETLCHGKTIAPVTVVIRDEHYRTVGSVNVVVSVSEVLCDSK